MLRILIDADTLELLGEIGYKRAVETQVDRKWPVFDNANVFGETYGYSSNDFNQRFDQWRLGKIKFATEPTLVGQLNFQISCYDMLFTQRAKKIGLQGVEYLRNKLLEIVK